MLASTTDPVIYKRHRYPTEIIAHAVWLSFRFPLSYRDVAELLAARGIPGSDETVRRWSLPSARSDARVETKEQAFKWLRK